MCSGWIERGVPQTGPLPGRGNAANTETSKHKESAMNTRLINIARRPTPSEDNAKPEYPTPPPANQSPDTSNQFLDGDEVATYATSHEAAGLAA
jgi:hypothetical protein